MAQRKPVMIFIIMALVLAIVSGCSGSKSNSNSKASESQGSSTPSVSPESTPSASEKQVTFEDAPVVKIMLIEGDPTQRTESKLDDVDNPYSRFIFEKTGIKMILDRQPENGYDQKVQLTLASSSDIDLMFLAYSSEVSMNIARSGALEPLNDSIDKYENVKATYNDEYWQGASFDKNKYLLGNMYLYPKADSATLIRQDWLDKLKLPMPKTVDDLFTVAKAFVDKKPDGQTTFGLTGRKNLSYFFAISSAYGMPNGHPEEPYFYLDKAKQSVVLWQTTDAARAYFAETQKFWKAGLIDKEVVSGSGDQFWNKINNGEVGIINHQPVSVGWLTTSIRQTQKSDKPLLAVVPPLTGTGFKNPFGAEGTLEMASPYDGFFGIPKGNKNIDNVMKVLDFLCSKDGMEFNKYGIEGIEHDIVDGKKVLNQERSGKVSFLHEYAITGNPALVQEGEYLDLSVKTLAGGGDAQYDPGDGPINRVKQAYDMVMPTLVPTQAWRLIIPRQPEEDNYPDYISAMTALYIKMVTAEYDATKDSDWQKYLSEVDKTGINAIVKAKETYLKTNAPQFFN